MPLLQILSMHNGGTITVFNDRHGDVTVNTMSDGPAFDALLKVADEEQKRTNHSRVQLSPTLLGILRELRAERSQTLTNELRDAIGKLMRDLFTEVRVVPEVVPIAPGTTITLYFGESTAQFYEDYVDLIEEVL